MVIIWWCSCCQHTTDIILAPRLPFVCVWGWSHDWILVVNNNGRDEGLGSKTLLLTDIGMTQVFEEGDFTNGSARRSFFVFQPDLFQRHQVVRQARLALVDRGVRSLCEMTKTHT